MIIDALALLTIFIMIGKAGRIKEDYGRWLKHTFVAAAFAITANILIALSASESFAGFSYCTYFASIDWVLYFLTGFCMIYTEHEHILKKLMYVFASLMMIDSFSIFLNMELNHEFYVYESTLPFGIFYQTGFYPLYYTHLALDYALVVFTLFFIIYRITKTYSIYRIKYVIILSVVILVIVLNILYMTLDLVLDASVIFYAVAGILIYFGTTLFVPRSLKIVAMERAIDDMNEGLILFELNEHCIYANDFARTRFDIDPDEYDLSCEPCKTVVQQLSGGEGPYGSVSYTTSSQYGKRHDLFYSIRYNSLTDKKGRHIGSYFLIEDTTETEYLMKELNEAKIAADSANKAKSDFLASMSHEIRTPLNSVLGMNEMILRSTDDPQLVEYANNIRQSGDTLLSLINDILDFSRIEAKKMDIIETEYDLHDILREIYIYFEQSAAEKDLYVNINCDENIPSGLVGDTRHIKQVFTNIISNAIKYTSVGGVTVDVNGSAVSSNLFDLIISISDTGMGIDPSQIDSLFDAFTRIDEKKNATIQGTGLGLAITKELVDLMGGSIEVSSKPGSGSTFTVRIPNKISDASPKGRFVKEPAPVVKKYKESFVAKDVKLLVVDDVKLNITLVKALLKKTGISIDMALGGAEAIDLCKNNKYDIILLDHRMPDPDGVETFKVISKEGLNTDTPVIMLTANALSDARQEYLDMGFTDYLSKPVKGEDLEKTLKEHLPKDKLEDPD